MNYELSRIPPRTRAQPRYRPRITAAGLKCQRFLADEAERLGKSSSETQNYPAIAPNPVGLTESAVAELNRKLNLM
ncbi:MAG TPA: hypothetical protein VJA21_29820 [Verrucomicrobiae bacterium]